jgi:uncharacterized protein (DUF2147 family)
MRARTAPVALAAFFLTAAQEPPPPSIDGQWTNPTGSVIINIAPCGDVHCGTVAWASEKAIADARKGTDHLVGSDLLTGLQRKKNGQWQGRLFVPDQKLRVKAKIVLIGDERLKVTGCAVAICKSQLWNRSSQPIPAA